MATDNREAFSRLVEMHQNGLRRFLLNMCNGDMMLVDDIAQETFLKAWLGIRRFEGLSGFKTRLYRIAVNEYISYRRSRPAAMLNEAADLSEVQRPDLSGGVESTEARMDSAVLLSKLSETERTVALLFYLEEMSIKDIVKITGITEGTVKSHLSRARKKMAKIE